MRSLFQALLVLATELARADLQFGDNIIY